jgi:hypothetical protein
MAQMARWFEKRGSVAAATDVTSTYCCSRIPRARGAVRAEHLRRPYAARLRRDVRLVMPSWRCGVGPELRALLS